MESRSINDLHPALAYSFGMACGLWECKYPNAPKPFLTCTHRGNEEQGKLYAQGRTTPGKVVTNAKPGESAHNYLPSLALDVAFKYESGELDWDARLFAQFAKLMKGVVWGGNFKSVPADGPHFELPDWKTRIPKQQVSVPPPPPAPPASRVIKEGHTPASADRPAPPKR